jgi:hypothetical protein
MNATNHETHERRELLTGAASGRYALCVKLWLLVTFCACWPGSPTEPVLGERHVRTPSARVTGQVMIDGKPARHYGVTLVHSDIWGVAELPTEVASAKDGRFEITTADPGPWDVIIAGRDFARRELLGKEFKRGHVTDLGVIEVARGSELDGRVTDEQGAPVTDAVVRVTTTRKASEYSVPPPTEDLARIARGLFESKTDSIGHYQISNFASLESEHSTIVAYSKDGAASVPLLLSNHSATMDLVVLPTGSIDGTVVGAPRGIVVADAVGVALAASSFCSIAAGAFSFKDLPVGDYYVYKFPITARSAAQRVTVVAGTSTHVVITP